MSFRPHTSFLAGFLTAGLLMGGVAIAGEIASQQIQVFYSPLAYYFNGVQKTPPADQKGFVYNGRTYVPLRFISESLGQKVQYDPETYSIYVGRRPDPLPEIWATGKTRGAGSLKMQYFKEGASTAKGVEMPNSVLVTSHAVGPVTPELSNQTVEYDYLLPAGTKRISGTVFVPDLYYGHFEDRTLGKILVLNEKATAIYSQEVTTLGENLELDVDLAGWQQARILVILYPYHGTDFEDDGILTVQIGISDLVIE